MKIHSTLHVLYFFFMRHHIMLHYRCITSHPSAFPMHKLFFQMCHKKMLPCHKFWAVKTCFNTNRHTCLSHPPHCGSRSETLVVWGPLFTNQPRGITVLWKNRQSMQGGCLWFTQPVFRIWIWIRINPHSERQPRST